MLTDENHKSAVLQRYAVTGNQWLESSFAEKVLAVLVHTLNESKRCGLCLLYAGLVPTVCWTVLTGVQVEVCDSSHLFNTCETSSGVLCPVVGSLLQERC